MSLVCGWLFAAAVVGCGEDTPQDPFLVHNTSAGGTGAEGGAATDAGGAPAEPDPGLGAPCLDDAQCNDDIDCTNDACDDEAGRCRHVPEDELCHDDVYCDGDEVCEPSSGCLEGDPIACSDDNTCTIDRCVEETRSCEYLERDMDSDGDAVWNCSDGGDCDDQNPRVSSLHAEVCSNDVDDDCDERVDEPDCDSADYDECDTALAIEASGSYALSFAATKGDYGLSCVDNDDWVDVVIELSIPDGSPRDVDIVVESDGVSAALALQASCGDASSELLCSAAVESDTGPTRARMRAFGLGPGIHSLVVFADAEGEATLDVSFEEASSVPTNETCATAQTLEPGSVVSALPYVATIDHESACASKVGDLVYEFALAEPSDVHLYASSLDGLGEPVVSLRSEQCTGLASELSCRSQGAQAHLFARGLDAGKYYALVSSSGPSATSLLLELEPVSDAPDTDDCATAPRVPASGSATLSMSEHTESIVPGCLVGAVDAAFQLEIEERSDVLLLQNFTEIDQAAVGLAASDCSDPVPLLCARAEVSPLRLVAPSLEPGDYRVISESAQASSLRLQVFQRPANPSVLVPFSDDCESAVLIPENGGHFQGNTAAVGANYPASCDHSQIDPPGAPDQMLRLNLSQPRRVVFDMRGSEYQTLLVVRSAEDCPGEEVAFGCSPNFGLDESYLDLELPAGDYFVQIDGYAGASGPWQLDVFTALL